MSHNYEGHSDLSEDQNLARERGYRLREEAMHMTGTGEACNRAERLINEGNRLIEENGGRNDTPEPQKRSCWDRDIR